ncbi:MAG TPA: rhomboid family intramembrane serine protease [Actinomycetota bacterium]|jgi:membrane associated rhomboid family serine protease|nr:rhomboid family intramembrane serine protease [Actinomycetota bacterium]
MTDPAGEPRTIEQPGETYCYAHPKEPTRLQCTRCGRPICGRCAIPASVGQHCPECVAEARRNAPKVRSVAARTAPVVVGLLIVNGAFFVAQQTIPGVTERLVMDPIAIATRGEWWRLFTSIVLHSPVQFLHIMFNSLVLWIYGPQLEAVFGHVRFFGVYLVAGLSGNAASFALGRCAGSLGASGAIFGIVGALAVFLYRRRSSQIASQFLSGLMFFVAINLLFGFMVPRIDNLAHLGGLAGGALLGWGLDDGSSRPPSVARQLATFAAVGGAAAGAIAYKTANFGCAGLFG